MSNLLKTGDRSDLFYIRKIECSEVDLIEQFIANLGNASNTFRYFNTRSHDIISNHIITCLAFDTFENPVAYGHLDPHEGSNWLGVCVQEAFYGKGLGKRMVNYLLQYAKNKNIPEVCLTVDVQNIAALSLYKKSGFIETTRNEKIIHMRILIPNYTKI
ncbi:GNAT family N-acetyltransferase [Synechococcus sp. W2B2]|uniref:GNAT family N-acetyltransferase n=1 Tax=unclassified Synechococcus TaxID=2626047 RepID=UPI0003238D37|nr:GNAT family N-acetyltransferase [Synechococcus sp. WH 7805]